MKLLLLPVIPLLLMPILATGEEDPYGRVVASIAQAIEEAEKKGPDPNDPYVDLVEKQVFDAAGKECDRRHPDVLMDSIECSGKISRELRKRGVIRGNKYYAQKHYGPLSNQELVKQYEKLYQLAVSDDAPLENSGSSEVGLVTDGDLKAEMAWVHRELVRRKVKFTPRIRVY